MTKSFSLYITIQAGNASFGKTLWHDSAAGCLPLCHYHHEHHFLKTLPRIKSALMHCLDCLCGTIFCKKEFSNFILAVNNWNSSHEFFL